MKKLSLILGMTLMASMAFAEEGTSTATTSSTTSTVEKSQVVPKDAEQKDIDEEITNARMRATLGSKSRISFKSSLAYSGGSIKKPFDRIRPNYRAGANVQGLASLGGSIGLNYRLTERDNLGLSGGISIRNPFHENLSVANFQDPRTTKERTIKRVNLSSPSIDWSRAYKAAGMQMVTEAGYTHATDEDSVRDAKMIGSVSFGQTVLADLGDSNWSAGLAASVYYSFYREGLSDFAKEQGALQDDFGYGLYPFAEYTFNDTFSFRTVFGYFESVHYKENANLAAGAVEAQVPYQSVGIGISVTRDIYLYPNIQFTPLDIRPERTNVALSTNLNLF